MSRFLVDYDQTLADTQGAMNDHMSLVFNKQFELEKITSWVNNGYFTEEEAIYRWGPQCFLNTTLQENAKPVAGAIEGMFHLLNEGHTAIIVSDRPTSLFEVTRNWLDDHGLDSVRLLFTHHKHSKSDNNKAMSKYQAAWSHKLSYIIEDAPHHANVFGSKPYIERIFLLDYPYNQTDHVPNNEKITRIKSWGDIPWKNLP